MGAAVNLRPLRVAVAVALSVGITSPPAHATRPRYRGIELLWQPLLVIPLGHEQAPVFGGEKRLGAAPGIVGLAFIGRVLF
jgi:hypothetical protein